MAKIREICLKLPEATEGVSWGHPTFKAGKKAFAVLDEYNRGLCISFKAMPSAKEVLLKDPRFFRAPYADSQGWVCLKTNARLDWKEVKNFILQSYRQVALKRMLSKLEDPG
ncbi:MAG TPA: MmcQ/YjbR family DNA-binding protein [Acidobacteriota bacterium]|nr:MmcQ/YjbR family DNA-binding protein [Acidobacteriota bacterium]